jgi:hypothetical protein
LAVVVANLAWGAPVAVKKFDISGSGSCARARWGDLNGDGRLDFLMVQPTNDNPSYVQMLTAYDGVTGAKLWQIGRDNGLNGTDRDEPAQIYDIDNDGRTEVIAAMAGELRFYGGADGELKKSFPLPAGDAHDAILFANFSKNATAQDIVLKNRYTKAWVVDINGKLLWTYSGITGHYPWTYDTNGDGRDELFVGYSQLDYQGKPVYPAPFNYDHPDCIWLGDVDNNPDNGLEVVYGLAQAPSLQAVNTRSGKVVWRNNDSRESQQIIIGDFRKDLPGLETYGMDRVNRTTQDAVFIVDSSGKLIWRETPDNSGFGTAIKLVRNWDGTDTALCLAIKRGSGVRPELRDGKGAIVDRIGADGENAAVVDIAGDSKQEIVMYSKTEMTVYSNGPLDYNQPPPNPGHPMPQVKEYYNYSRYGSGDANAGPKPTPSAGGGTGVGGSTSAAGSAGATGGRTSSTSTGVEAGATSSGGGIGVAAGGNGWGSTPNVALAGSGGMVGGLTGSATQPPRGGAPMTGGAQSGTAGVATSGQSSTTTVIDGPPSEEPGCSCRVTSRRSDAVSVGLFGILGLGLMRTRRRVRVVS